jgi:hypothetical protein
LVGGSETNLPAEMPQGQCWQMMLEMRIVPYL